MKTRQDYLNGNCTHSEYYAQFVRESMKNAIGRNIGVERLKQAFKEDQNLNTIPLAIWDNMSHSISFPDMKDYGEFRTLAGSVCILKEAARQLCESLKD
jgi:hypothetical protein